MHRISRTASFVAGAVLGACALAGGVASASGGISSTDLLRAPLQGSQLSDPPLFGLNRGGAPWVISDGSARLGADGGLRVKVVGLIIPTQHANPHATLSATVVCNGMAVATTRPVPFSAAGDAVVDTHVMLPERCLAPAVLVNPLSNVGVYIAATGR